MSRTKKGKKILVKMMSFFLVVVMIVPLLSSNDKVQAATTITETQLFMQAPMYLDNQKLNEYFIKCEDDCVSALESVSTSEVLIASYLEGLKSGGEYIVKEAASFLGVTDSNFDSKNKELAGELLREYLGNADFMEGVSEEVSQQYSFMSDAVDFSVEVSRESFINSMKDNNTTFTDAEIEEIFEDADLVNKIVGKYGDAEDACKVLVSLVQLYQIEVEAIDQLISIENLDSSLMEGLVAIRNDITENPATYILSTYGTDKILEKIEKQIMSSSVEAISKSATILCKIVISATKLAYEQFNPSMEEILHATLLQSYTRTADNAVNDLYMKFYKGEGTEEDIVKYRAAFNFYVASLKMYMEECEKLVEKEDRALYHSLDVYGDTLGTTINYDCHLKMCLANANKAISTGTLVINEDEVIKKTDDGTVINEEYDSAESIAARFAAIQAQYVPNVGQTWNGSYNGCIQCCGFAQLVFNKLFGYNLSGYYGNRRYMIRVENKVDIVGQLVGSEVTVDNVKAMFANAKTGDYIQMDGASYGQHSAIVAGVDDTGVMVYDCNSKPHGETTNCLINQWKVTWANWAKWYGSPSGTRPNGISVYRAKNYGEIYGDGTNLFYDDTANFVITDGVLTKYNGWQTHVKIPEEVTAIGDNAFKNNTTMMSVEIPNTVTSIGASAFYGCTELVAIYIPDSVETIGSSAFYGCTSLASVKLPENENFTVLSSSVFYQCTNLKSVEIPDSVTEIQSSAFSYCTNLSEVDLPSKLVTIGQAFAYCDKIESITIPRSLEKVDSGWGVFYKCAGLKEVIFEEEIVKIESGLFSYCTGLEEITIPDTVTTIESSAFYECSNLQKVEIPDSVTEIESSIFYDCISLKEVNIPNSVTLMGSSVFSGCSNLQKVHLPESRKTLMDYTFYNCTSLTEVNFPDTLETIGTSAFYNCTSLTEVNLPSNVNTINSSAFYGCTGLTKVTIPASMRTINSSAFSHCEALTDLTIAEGVTTIYSNAFEYCKALQTVTLPDSLQTLGSYAFRYCDVLSEVNIGAGLKVIPSYCFYEDPALEKIVLPQQVTTINQYAFGNCTAFTDVTMNRNVTSAALNAFSYPDNLTIHGVSGTYAQEFANENEIFFEPLSAPTTAIKLNATEKRLARGYTAQMTANITPADSSDQLTWTSSDEDIVTVDANGQIKGIATGTATIIAMAGDVMEFCEVTV